MAVYLKDGEVLQSDDGISTDTEDIASITRDLLQGDSGVLGFESWKNEGTYIVPARNINYVYIYKDAEDNEQGTV